MTSSSFGTAYRDVFKLDAAGTLTTLHRFSGADGAGPSRVIQGTDGSLYGTTWDGSAWRWDGLELDAAGTLTTLHHFADGSDGRAYSGVIEGRDSSFYSTTSWSGVASSTTRLLQLDAAGALTTLHRFSGIVCLTGVTQGSDGSLYGVTREGSGIPAMIYRLTPTMNINAGGR